MIRKIIAALVAALAFASAPALATTQNFSNTSSVSFTATQPATTDAVTVTITSTSTSGSCTVSISSPAFSGDGMTWTGSYPTGTTLYVGPAGAWTITSIGCTITGSVTYT